MRRTDDNRVEITTKELLEIAIARDTRTLAIADPNNLAVRIYDMLWTCPEDYNPDADHDMTVPRELQMFPCDLCEGVDKYVRDMFGFAIDAERVTFNPLKLNLAKSFFDLLYNEYGEKNDTMWRAFGLSGDDDVDYNGSHPSWFCDVLLAICAYYNVATA